MEREPRTSPARIEEVFKCSRCGTMFPTDGLDQKICPVCGRLVNRREDEVLIENIEGF